MNTRSVEVWWQARFRCLPRCGSVFLLAALPCGRAKEVMSSPPPSLPDAPYSVKPPAFPTNKFPVFWVVLSSIVGAALGAGACMLTRSEEPAPVVSAVASTAPVESAKPKVPAPPPPTLEQRAARGDQDAVKAIEAKPEGERTAAELAALERAADASQRARIAELKRKTELLPDFGRSPDTKKELVSLARDERYYVDAQEMLASLDNTVGPDLLYVVWAGTHRRTPATELAQALSYSKEVRSHASKELELVLQLRRVDDCSKAVELLEQAEEYGDRRTLTAMQRFNRRHGCGANERADCWSCMRNSQVLRDASAAARKRVAPL